MFHIYVQSGKNMNFCDRSELKDFYLGHRWLSRATFLEPRIFISHGAENPAL